MVGGQQYKLSSKVQTTVNFVREIVGGHSEAEILAVLRETNMDPSETVQKLLYQDPFHEVKRRRDKKKENTGSKDSKQPQVLADHSLPSARMQKPTNLSAQVGRLSSRNRPSAAGAGTEFRVVRDNRENQDINRDQNPEIPRRSFFGIERAGTRFREKSYSRHQDSKNFSSSRAEYRPLSQATNTSLKASENAEVSPEAGASTLKSLTQGQKGIVSGPPSPSEIPAATSSSSGVYASSSDPVHVPDSRSASIVGAIGREVGVVGGRRHPSDRPVSHSSFPNSSFSPIPDSFQHSTGRLESQAPASESVVLGNRPFSGHQYHNKLHPQSNMEWRPKSSQKLVNVVQQSPPTATEEVAPPSASVSDVKIDDIKHVIIPNHLRVPEAEKAGLTFGNFGSTFDSAKSHTTIETASAEPSVSTSISGEEHSFIDQADVADGQLMTSQAESPEEVEASRSSDRGNYPDVGLAQAQSSSYQTPSPLPSFSEAYDLQHGYDGQFFHSGMDDALHGQRLTSPAEVVGSAGLAMVQQQAMLYPQVHLTHYPNFMPYRQVLSPMYVPPMAIPGYSSGGGYVLMPGTKYKPLYASDDVSRVKFKETGPYAAATQVEGAEIWVQPQREMPGFYNVSGQAAHPAAYSHLQFPGVYHQATVAGPHHLATPSAAVVQPPGSVGSYQQPQVSHLGWTGGF